MQRVRALSRRSARSAGFVVQRETINGRLERVPSAPKKPTRIATGPAANNSGSILSRDQMYSSSPSAATATSTRAGSC